MKRPWIFGFLAIALAFLIYLIQAPVLRYLIAFIFLWIIPGLTWATLIPQPISRMERLITSIGLNFVITPVTTLWTYYLPGALTQGEVLLSITGITLLPLVISQLQHAHKVSPAAATPDNNNSLSPKPVSHSTSPWSRQHSFWKDGWAWLLIILLLAATLRIVNLNYSEFQGDEGTVMVRAAQALEGDETVIFQHKKGPAELMTVMALWRLTGITNEWMARLPFTWANLLGIAAIFILVRRLISLRTAIIVVCILSIEGYFTAFGRIVQYQSLVFLLSTLGLFMLLAYNESGRPYFILFSAAFFAGGFLGHYDAALPLPAGLLLIVDYLSRNRQQVRRHLPIIAIAAILGFLLIAQFYIPFLTSPFIKHTISYLSERIGQTQPFYNNFRFAFRLSAVYDSIYMLGVLSFFLSAQILIAWNQWNQHKSTRILTSLIASILFLATLSTAIWPETWRLHEHLTLAWLPLTLLLLSTLFIPTLPVQTRFLWLWFSLPALFYLFRVASPNTHIHTFFTPGIILAAIEMTTLLNYLTHQPKILKWTAVVLGSVLYILCGYYTIMMFVDHTPEYRRTFPEFKNPLYWTPYEEIPKDGLFGFPYRAGWKVVGYLMDQGKISSYYKSNEEPQVTTFYTHQAYWWEYTSPDTYITAVNVQDEREIDWEAIRTRYSPVAAVAINSQPKLTIYQNNSSFSSPQTYDGQAYDWAFDLASTPERIAYPKSTPTQLLPETYTSTMFTLGDFVQLEGYTLDATHAVPGGYIELVLIWYPLTSTTMDYHIFTHLYDGQTLHGQLDNRPMYNTFPTYCWQPGMLIPDHYRIPINDDAPLRSIPLLIGMYDFTTMQRLPVTDTNGQSIGDTIHLTNVMIREH